MLTSVVKIFAALLNYIVFILAQDLINLLTPAALKQLFIPEEITGLILFKWR